jgi:hypothetical protein
MSLPVQSMVEVMRLESSKCPFVGDALLRHPLLLWGALNSCCSHIREGRLLPLGRPSGTDVLYSHHGFVMLQLPAFGRSKLDPL